MYYFHSVITYKRPHKKIEKKNHFKYERPQAGQNSQIKNQIV